MLNKETTRKPKEKLREDIDLAFACRIRSREALEVIIRIMEDSKIEKNRLEAAKIIIERGYGKPIQPNTNQNSGEIIFKWKPSD